jgi:prepilin-type N-terminal cleavage/methylation domain-containing protein
MKRTSDGVTLVEVLVAVVVLAVGIAMLLFLQGNSLQTTNRAQAINETTRLVRGELEWQRQTALAPGDIECSYLIPEGFNSCTVEIMPCSLVFEDDGTSSLVCAPEVSPSSYQITVSAQGPQGTELTLSTLWSGIFIAGAAGSTGAGE